MNRKGFYLIIVLMTIALIGLMVIQSFWIRNAIVVKEAGFNQNVNEAMRSVVYQLEKLDAVRRLNRQQDYLRERNRWIQTLDSLNKILFENPGMMFNPLEFNRFMQKSIIAQDVLESLMHPSDLPVEKRIDINQLDSLIASELANRGIRTEYEFGVYNPAENKMPLQKSGRYPEKLLKEGFSFALFPSDIARNPSYLMIWFPNEKRFLITQLWQILTISLAFVLLIIFSFAYTVSTVLRQKKLSEMKNDFINNMTHEIKTPISTISLACQALSDKDIIKSEELYQNYIRVINEENQRLGRLTERILQSATLEKGEILLRKEVIDLHTIVKDAMDKIRLQVEKRGGRLVEELHAQNRLIEADKVHITNVIYNLLDNANKYTEKTPLITVRTENSFSGILLSVEDNGPGISKANQRKIFEKLYRIPTGNLHNVKGFGLGLSYVKMIVEQHGGKVTLESELNKGSKFTIFLPLYQPVSIKKEDENKNIAG